MIIYIVAPAKVASGGPELLHQLYYKLNLFGFKAYMLYIGYDLADPVHDNYKHFQPEYVTEFQDSEENIVILPETATVLISQIKNCKKVIWWLSVDNYIEDMNQGNVVSNIWDNSILHFAQSAYAMKFLNNLTIPDNRIFYLSDYLNQVFIENAVWNNKEKEDLILYNPKKGYEYTKKLMLKGKNLNWVPLKDLTPLQMAKLLKRSKIYIDFGNHPGKDRIPREAAISGCCVITGKKGSAGFKEDIPIDEEFKFEDSDRNIDDILCKIQDILKNYEVYSNRFEAYRNRIRMEENVFDHDLSAIFEKLSTV